MYKDSDGDKECIKIIQLSSHNFYYNISNRTLKKINIHFFKYKGLFGIFFLESSTLRISPKLIRKWLLFLYSLLVLINKVLYGFIAVVGRGMHVQSFARGLFRGQSHLRRQKKYTRAVLYEKKKKKIKVKKETELKTKVVEKKKKVRRRKRRLSLKSFNRRKWFSFRYLDRRTYTHFSERGHFILKNLGIKIFFRRLNTLYKYLMLGTIGLRIKHLSLILVIVLLLKQFAKYKIKGLKFFYNKIKVKEGKGRRF